MRYSEIINEGKDAPLYHATNWYDGIDIIHENTLRTKTTHRISRYLDSIFKIPQSIKKSSVFADDYDVDVISLTRSFHFAKKWIKNNIPFILIIDQTKLAYNHKIIPFDYWMKNFVHDLQMYNEVDDDPELENQILKRWESIEKRRKTPAFTESEEFLLKDIKNLDKYLLGIYTDIDFLKQQPDIDKTTLAKIQYWNDTSIVKRMK